MSHNAGEKSAKLVQIGERSILLSNQMLVVASLLLGVLCVTLFILISRRKSALRGNTLLLVGPPDAGKTAILLSLAYKQTIPTHTSLQINSSLLALSPSKTIRIVDVPGHPRIRDQFREHLSDAKAIAFVVDSSAISRNASAIAEHLHHILHALTSLPPSHALPALVILAHKSDLLKLGSSSGTAEDHAVTRVKTILERELEKRRASQVGGVGVEGLGEEGERTELGGLECSGPSGGAFKFTEWEGGEIDFIGTCVIPGQKDEEKREEEDGLSPLVDRLNDLF